MQSAVRGNALGYEIHGVGRPNLAKPNADGTLDPDFPPAAPNGRVQQIVLKSDDKILLGGAFTVIGGQWHPMLARLNSAGSLDPGLGLQADGKILVGYIDASFVGTCTRLNPMAPGTPASGDRRFQPGHRHLR